MERRQAVRVPWVTGVECEEVDTGVRRVGAQLSDISLSGVFLHGVPVLPRGARLRLRFALPSLQMQVDAAVVHTTPAGGMGLTFLDLTPIHRVVIQELMRTDEGGRDSPAEAGAPADPQTGLAADGSLETLKLRPPVKVQLRPPVKVQLRPPARAEYDGAAAPVDPPAPEPALPDTSVPGPAATGESTADGAPSDEAPSGARRSEPREPESALDETAAAAAPVEPASAGAEEPSVPEEETAPPEQTAAPEPAGQEIDDVWPPPLPPLPPPPPPRTRGPHPAEPPIVVEPGSAEPPAVEEPEPAVARAPPTAEPLAAAATEEETPPPPAESVPAALASEKETPPLPDAEEDEPERPPRVLIVDDHDRTRIMLRGMIEGREKAFEVTEACDGEDCLRVVDAEGPFDLIFLDVDMPRLDGLGACRELRARGVRAPIIFLTGRSELGDFRAGREAGADTYIKKPIVLGTLRSMLGLFTSGSLQRR